jgi:hypothetical protein
MSAIIHINDNNILLHNGDRVSRSQGYAWLSGAEVYFDLDAQNKAVKHCRLEPQQINSSYWQQCAQTTIASNQSGMRHAADLIWRHLGELQTTQALSEVKLVVPSHYQGANLQLLLGICKASNLQVNGVVNKAVLALQQNISEVGHYLHIDVQLHQTVCSEVIAEVDSSGVASIVLGEIEILHEVGLQAMQDALLKGIQQRFILSDRFDPLHYAETEQQLFDQLPELASTLRDQGKANISVQHQGRQHATSIDLKQWNTALEAYAQQLDTVLVSAPADHCYYDFNSFQALSFSNDKQTSIDQNKEVLTAHAAVLNALTSSELSDQADKIIYRTELGLDLDQPSSSIQKQHKPRASSVPVTLSESSSQLTDSKLNQVVDGPTHLLQAGQAIPLANAQIELDGRQIKLHLGTSSNLAELLNSEKLFILNDTSRNQLQVDDRLASDLADGVITVISVLDSCTVRGN